MELECVENTDCSATESCVNNKCEDVCRLDGVCGTNANCRTRNHVPLCSCREGFDGDPRIGCNRVIACARDVECPTNMMCAFGVCSPRCSSIRDCLETQVCANEKCVPKCASDRDCPSGVSRCRGGVCVLNEGCSNDGDCNDSHVCRPSAAANFRRECVDACTVPNACGKNAGCRAVGHKAQCICPQGKICFVHYWKSRF